MSRLDNVVRGPSKRPPRIAMIGVEGVGKSTAGANLPDPIFICGEDGLVGPEFNDTTSYVPKDWLDVLGFVADLIKDEHAYKSLVIDTMDWLEPLLYAYICKRDQGDKKWNNVEEYGGGYGKGYTVAAEELRRLLSGLEKLQATRKMIIFITTHCYVKQFNNPIGDNYDKYQMKIAPKVAGVLKEWCDVVLFANYEIFTQKKKGDTKAKGAGGDKRVVKTVNHAAWEAKNRYGMPRELPLDMGVILDAIKKGEPEDINSIKTQLEEMIPDLPDDKQQPAREYLAKWPNNTNKLYQLLNRVKAQMEE